MIFTGKPSDLSDGTLIYQITLLSGSNKGSFIDHVWEEMGKLK